MYQFLGQIMFHSIKKYGIALGGLVLCAGVSNAGELEDLKKRVAMLEDLQIAMAEKVETTSGSKSAFENTHLGGYGELHYNNLDGENGAGDKDQIDFHRFVLEIHHNFSEDITLHTELELEHSLSGSGKPGEVELEQAYVDVKLNEDHFAKVGLFLLPVGFLNESHEPETFYGVERNPVEKNILPTTWWEAGFGFSGRLADQLRYDVAFHSGLETGGASSYKIRSGRQKVASATAKDFAYTGRLTWMPLEGLKSSLVLQYQSDVTQSGNTAAGSGTLINLNLEYAYKDLTLRGLYGTWDLDGTAPESIGADEQTGFYVEASYKVRENLGVFARMNQYDNTAGSNGGTSEKEQIDLGLNYWLHPNVVLKADVQLQNNENSSDQNGYNLGFGYSF
jgi:hypothetical protein